MNLLESRLKRLVESMIGTTVSSFTSSTKTSDLRPMSEYPGSRPSLVRKGTVYHEITIGFTMAAAIKEAAPGAREELLRQIEALLSIDPSWAIYFPTILAVHTEIEPPYYVMRHYPYPSFRDLLLAGQLSAHAGVAFLQRVLDFLFAKVYEKNVQPTGAHFIAEAHTDRIRRRLNSLSGVSPYFAKLVAADVIRIGGRVFSNILPLIERIERNAALKNTLQPARLNEIHGDLELAHILVNSSGNGGPEFILLDPRFPGASDVAYDLGKLWQSMDGLLDLIAAGRFRLEVIESASRTPEFDVFEMLDQVSVALLNDIAKMMPGTLERYDLIRQDPHWWKRMEFSAIAHICSAGPFYLRQDGREEAALGLYVRGLQLLNRFVERWL